MLKGYCSGGKVMKNKVVMLSLCLMQENTRKLNNATLDYALEHYDIDLIVINAQEFEDYDYREHPKVMYIGKHNKRQGFVKGRNQLLEWFYNSDYDWAVWLDSNVKIAKTALNDFRTVLHAVKSGDLDAVDFIASTLGNHITQSRIDAKMAFDHDKTVKVTTLGKSKDTGWFAGLMMCNLNKKHQLKVFIPLECVSEKGLMEDTYFVTLCRKYFEYRVCPTMVIVIPPAKTTTWRDSSKGFKYPPVAWDILNRMILGSGIKVKSRGYVQRTFVIPRISYMIHEVGNYKERKKKVRGGLF